MIIYQKDKFNIISQFISNINDQLWYQGKIDNFEKTCSISIKNLKNINPFDYKHQLVVYNENEQIRTHNLKFQKTYIGEVDKEKMDSITVRLKDETYWKPFKCTISYSKLMFT